MTASGIAYLMRRHLFKTGWSQVAAAAQVGVSARMLKRCLACKRTSERVEDAILALPVLPAGDPRRRKLTGPARRMLRLEAEAALLKRISESRIFWGGGGHRAATDIKDLGKAMETLNRTARSEASR
jgi:hypothetical protein